MHNTELILLGRIFETCSQSQRAIVALDRKVGILDRRVARMEQGKVAPISRRERWIVNGLTLAFPAITFYVTGSMEKAWQTFQAASHLFK